MKRTLFSSFILTSFCLLQLSLFSNSHCSTHFNLELFKELKVMCEKDQEARFRVINSQIDQVRNLETVKKIDQEHLFRLKNIIGNFGWPGFELVGEEGADNIWLLIQHCDQDLEFQKTCLILLEKAVEKKDAPKRHLAYLMDRVLINEGKEQVYGTQIQIIEGQALAFPIQDLENLEKRREIMGLCPFSEYLVSIKEMYHLEN